MRRCRIVQSKRLRRKHRNSDPVFLVFAVLLRIPYVISRREKKMRFSVILPVFNREKSVIDAVNSIKKQTFSDWELIIIDDGSQDHTYEVCCDLKECDNRFKVFHQPNQGVSAARNHGLRIASGEYILFLDSDDMLEPNALVVLDRCIRSTSCPDIVCFGFSRMSGAMWLPHPDVCGVKYSADAISCGFLPDHLNLVPHGNYFLQPFVWNKCFRNTLIDKTHIRFDERMKTWEDSGFLIVCLAHAESLYLLGRCLYRTGDSGQNDHLGALYDAEVLRNFVQSCEDLEKQFGDRYDFSQPYWSMHNLELLRGILQKLRADEAYSQCVDAVFANPAVERWAVIASARSPMEVLTKAAFLTKNKWLLRQALADDNHLFRRLLRHIKKPAKGLILHV